MANNDPFESFKWKSWPAFSSQSSQTDIGPACYTNANEGTGSLPVSMLPDGHQRMRNIEAVYTSGYSSTYRPTDGLVTGIGEVVIVRTESTPSGTLYKAYNYGIGITGPAEDPVIGPEEKYFSGHHFTTTGALEFPSHAFGHIPWPNGNCSVTTTSPTDF